MHYSPLTNYVPAIEILLWDNYFIFYTHIFFNGMVKTNNLIGFASRLKLNLTTDADNGFRNGFWERIERIMDNRQSLFALAEGR